MYGKLQVLINLIVNEVEGNTVFDLIAMILKGIVLCNSFFEILLAEANNQVQ